MAAARTSGKIAQNRSQDVSECLIGPGTTIRGQVSGDQDLLVRGRIEGKVSLSKALIVESGATLEADVDAALADIDGTVSGDIKASGTLRLSASGKVTGKLSAPDIVLEDGAHFDGEIDMHVELPSDLKNVEA